MCMKNKTISTALVIAMAMATTRLSGPRSMKAAPTVRPGHDEVEDHEELDLLRVGRLNVGVSVREVQQRDQPVPILAVILQAFDHQEDAGECDGDAQELVDAACL